MIKKIHNKNDYIKHLVTLDEIIKNLKGKDYIIILISFKFMSYKFGLAYFS